ncbi:uncharacterized protein [Argopecten irradians]|uniref:uncharacterized protein n=1 Tax=Argopecten irradians TaxID=31199 RepID=UPI003722CE45
MDGQDFYKDPEVDYLGRTSRKKNRGSHIPVLNKRNMERDSWSGGPYDNYALNDDYSVGTADWNLMANSSKRHWSKAHWTEDYRRPSNVSDDDSYARQKHGRYHNPRRSRGDYPSDRRKRNPNILLFVMTVFILAATITIPLVIIFLFRQGSKTTQGTVNMEMRLAEPFQPGMEDSSSPVFKSTADELCSRVTQAMRSGGSFSVDTDITCNVDSLRNGSIIVVFVFTVSGTFAIPDNEQYVQAILSYIGADMALGSFTVIDGSVVVISASYTSQGAETLVTSPTTEQPTTAEQTTTTEQPTTTEQTTTTTTTTTEQTTTEQPTTTTEQPTTTTIPPHPGIQLVSSLSSLNGELVIDCSMQNVPNNWDEIKVASVNASIGVVAMGYENGTTQTDGNAYQTTFETGDSNISISLVFPNTTKHCFVRSNYTCELYTQGHIFVETMAYISIPVEDAAENLRVDGVTVVNEGDTYTLNCSGDLAPTSTSLDLYTRPPNMTSFVASSVDFVVVTGNPTDSCYIPTTKSYSLVANRTDNGTEVKCEAFTISSGSRTISDSRLILVDVAEINLVSSLLPISGELNIECNIRRAPRAWDEIKVMSTDSNIGVVAMGYGNGTTKTDGNAYQTTFETGVSNISISLVFPNTTKHCFVRSNYTCELYTQGKIVVETMAYISIPVEDAAENLRVDGVTVVNEGDTYTLNCSGDLAPTSTSLDLYTRPPNMTSFVASSVDFVVVTGNPTDSCYLPTTKSYSLVANRTDNGTEVKCEAFTISSGSRTISDSRLILVDVAEINLVSSLLPISGELNIECNIRRAPRAWDEIKVMSTDSNIGVVAMGYGNGTTKTDGNAYQTTFETGVSNISISLVFPNTTKHCFVRSNYTCELYTQGKIVVETMAYISIPVEDAAENLRVDGVTVVNEGDTYTLNCSGDLAPTSTSLDLYTRPPNMTSFVASSVDFVVVTGNPTDSCYIPTTKSYSLVANRTDNGTEVKCEAFTISSGSRTISDSRLILVDVAEINLVSSLLPISGELNIECNIRRAPRAWDEIKVMSTDSNIGVVAMGYGNGTTKTDGNAYQTTFETGVSNISISLVFPNTTKHCFVRSNYTCELYTQGKIVVETMAYISIPVEDAAENLRVDGVTVVNEGDTYTLNCSGDLAPTSTSLDLYTRPPNMTSFVASSVDFVVVTGNPTDSCYLPTTKSYSLVANRTDNGTEVKCEAFTISSGSRTISDSRLILVDVAEINLVSSLLPISGELNIECNIRKAPRAWDEIIVMSTDSNIGVVAMGYGIGITHTDGNAYQTTFETGDSNISISLVFPNKQNIVSSEVTTRANSIHKERLLWKQWHIFQYQLKMQQKI